MRAGRVGVNRSQVDYKGNVKAGGGSSEEIEQLRTDVDALESDVEALESDVALKVSAGVLHPTINNDFYITRSTDISTLHDDGADVTSLVYDCTEHIGGVLHIDINGTLTNTSFNRLRVGCVDSITEGAIVDDVNITFTESSYKDLCISIPVTKRYVIVYVYNDRLGDFYCNATLFY